MTCSWVFSMARIPRLTSPSLSSYTHTAREKHSEWQSQAGFPLLALIPALWHSPLSGSKQIKWSVVLSLTKPGNCCSCELVKEETAEWYNVCLGHAQCPGWPGSAISPSTVAKLQITCLATNRSLRQPLLKTKRNEIQYLFHSRIPAMWGNCPHFTVSAWIAH